MSRTFSNSLILQEENLKDQYLEISNGLWINFNLDFLLKYQFIQVQTLVSILQPISTYKQTG